MSEYPDHFEKCLQGYMAYTREGFLVWRVSLHNRNRFAAFPSDRVINSGILSSVVGTGVTGITIGYPESVARVKENLRLRISTHQGQHRVCYCDAPTANLKSLIEELHTLATEEQGKGIVAQWLPKIH